MPAAVKLDEDLSPLVAEPVGSVRTFRDATESNRFPQQTLQGSHSERTLFRENQ